jgi:hypothetical protein
MPPPDNRFRLGLGGIIEMLPVLMANFNDIAEAIRRDQGRSRVRTVEECICGCGRAMNEVENIFKWDLGSLNRLNNTL